MTFVTVTIGVRALGSNRHWLEVDGKYLRPTLLLQVAETGSEPARFAFQDAQVLFSRVDALDKALQAIVRYPSIQQLYDEPSSKTVAAFYGTVKNFWEWATIDAGWPVQFMQDSDLSWLAGSAPVDDL